MDMSAISRPANAGVVRRCRDRSSAKTVMRARRCAKLAGLGALSALCVLKSSKTRYGLFSEGACWRSAEVARLRWALEGGLKLESRMYSVFGCVDAGFTVRTTWKAADELVKERSADSKSGSAAFTDTIRDAILVV